MGSPRSPRGNVSEIVIKQQETRIAQLESELSMLRDGTIDDTKLRMVKLEQELSDCRNENLRLGLAAERAEEIYLQLKETQTKMEAQSEMKIEG
jgi:hypothetical protein